MNISRYGGMCIRVSESSAWVAEEWVVGYGECCPRGVAQASWAAKRVQTAQAPAMATLLTQDERSGSSGVWAGSANMQLPLPVTCTGRPMAALIS